MNEYQQEIESAIAYERELDAIIAGNSLTPNLRAAHPKQIEFLEAQAKRKVIRAGRRGGKTVGIAILACMAFLAGRRVLYAAPTQDQFERFWFEVKRCFERDIDAKRLTKNEIKHAIERPGTENRIRAKTAWNAETLRGDYADLLILDEWQLMNEDAWQVVGAPMLLDNDGDAVFIYTPPSIRSAGVSKAKDPLHAAKLFKKAKADETGRWQTFHFSSLDNPHLSRDALNEITQDITRRVYEQEILAIDKDDNPLALWTRDMIEPFRTTMVPAFQRIVVGVDPSATSGGAEAGIIGGGVGLCRCKGGDAEPHGFVLEDVSLQASPEKWANAAVTLYNKLQADRLVAESNNGGEMVQTTISTIPGAPYVTLLHASRGKFTRAEPIAALYERGLIHHVGTFPLLEDELCQYDNSSSQDSPNRYDALVWVMTEMLPNIRAGRPAMTPDERADKQMQQWGWPKRTEMPDDPMAWFSRELHEAQLRNQARLENKTGLGQWDALDEMQEQRELRQGLPEDLWN